MSSSSEYVALSGLRTRLETLDRLASDIANAGTIGYKGERRAQAAAMRDTFGTALQAAIDSTSGARRLDTAGGVITPTGLPLDAAIDGPGFFVVNTSAGTRYTRNGHFSRATDGSLVTEDGSAVQGVGGPLTLPPGDVRIDESGGIWSGKAKTGQLSVVEFDDPGQLTHDHASFLLGDGLAQKPAQKSKVRSGALEESNVSMNDRIAELTQTSRSFEALQHAVSLVMNDVDGRAIDQLGKR